MVVLALAAQACGGKEKEVSITPSSTTVETLATATPTPVLALTISVEDVKLKLDGGQNFTLVDVRDKQTFDESHIDTAISIPVDELPGRYEEVPQGLEIIIYAECA